MKNYNRVNNFIMLIIVIYTYVYLYIIYKIIEIPIKKYVRVNF